MENKMAEKLFTDLQVGDTFTVNGASYSKIPEVKISCCKSINAQATANSNNKTYFPGNTVVTING
jgi:hypothetical protein